jgi:hypothetical protein
VKSRKDHENGVSGRHVTEDKHEVLRNTILRSVQAFSCLTIEDKNMFIIIIIIIIITISCLWRVWGGVRGVPFHNL